MRSIIILLFCNCLASCSSQISTNNEQVSKKTSSISAPLDPSFIDTLALGINFKPSGSYEEIKRTIKQQIANGNHSGKDLEDYLINMIIPFWYGTPWDFNGYTAVPNEGVIACGYFVSTTLVHAGLDLNRYHLAQQAGLNEAKSLALEEKNYETIYGIDNLKNTLEEEYLDGLYFVGLDSHVGYLYIKHGEFYFIHSNYIENRVMIEKALTAPAFQSNIYVVAQITTNKELLEKWRKRETVRVIRS